MARGLIGKMVRGAADGLNKAAPFIMQEKRAKERRSLQEYVTDAQAKRDALLAKFASERQAADQEFTAGQNADRLDLQRQNLELNRQRLDLTGKQIEQQLQIGDFTIQEQNRLQNLYEIIMGESSEEELLNAVETLNYLKGNQPDKYQAITLYQDSDDPMEPQRRVGGVLDRTTGGVRFPSFPSQGGAEPPPGFLVD